MFEDKFKNGVLFKKVIDVFAEMAVNANLQAMETTNIAMLTHKNQSLGVLQKQTRKINLNHLQTILQFFENKDQITFRSQSKIQKYYLLHLNQKVQEINQSRKNK
ncbi:unnamed protein product [Paramecium sonneborni]|uniref:Proliferating cell nuclear antigen PCNA N-terminal domain-containing protein n=1 Tax=Paramecium sonneborni TaxID=65129 RepID=A0A8S1RPV7_9CILI|nr:unnamed protein product [Paramecium sonneborni]